MVYTQKQPNLKQLYSTVPGYSKILDGVLDGEIDFLQELRKLDMPSIYYPNTSQLHAYDDIRVQAVTLGIPSAGNPREIAVKSFLTFAAHFIDDVFDRPDLGPSFEKMTEHRQDIKSLLDSMGNVGELGHVMADKTRHPERVYQGLKKLAYGCLVQQARTQEQQDLFLAEYQQLSLDEISEPVRRDILNLRDIPFWLTNKVVLEIWRAVEPEYNPTVVELWNLAAAPALYLHDSKQEEQKGELNFFGRERPTFDEMNLMINIAAKHLTKYEDKRISQRLEQLRFLRKAFADVLPEELSDAYDNLEQVLNRYCLKKRESEL